VFHVLPNEVPILFVLGLISLQLREGSWRAGFHWPDSWRRTILLAVAAAVLLQLKSVVTEPIGDWIWHRPQEVSSTLRDISSVKVVVQRLGLVWTFAAFGEEVAYRGYLMRRAGDAFKWSPAGCAFALLWSSILFGFGHYYKGPSGVFESTVSGLVLGAAYLLTRRVLWAPVLAHGLSDTFAVVASYFGL